LFDRVHAEPRAYSDELSSNWILLILFSGLGVDRPVVLVPSNGDAVNSNLD